MENLLLWRGVANDVTKDRDTAVACKRKKKQEHIDNSGVILSLNRFVTMEQVEQQLDIETLLAGSSGLGRQNEVFDVLSGRGSWISPLQSEQHWKDFSHLAKPESDGLVDKRVDSRNEVPTSSGLELQKITVRGDDIGDLPTEYDVNGLEQHELPVIGTYIDPRVCVGFRYRVRNLGTGKYLFQGKGLHLRGIGMGYGKRITFKSERFNENSNYFYSDTQPDGYGFELVATEIGDQFDICDEENCVVGRATVESVDSMLPEIASKVTQTSGAIEKHVPITVTCTITNQVGSHGLLCLQTEETLQVSGVAVVVRERRSALATTVMIQDITLPSFGVCRLCQPQVPLQL